MKIVKMPAGEHAPKDSDCISIEQMADGRYRLEGSALINCGDSDEVESVSIVGSATYETFEAAEAAGMAWAETHCVERLYVSTSTVRSET